MSRYVGRLRKRFLSDQVGVAENLMLEKLKPKSGSGPDLQQAPPNGSCKNDKKRRRITRLLELVPTRNGYKIKLYVNIVKI